MCNGGSLILPPPDLLMVTDASTKGWGASCLGVSNGSPCRDHINMLELKAVKLGLLTFAKFRKVQRIHLQMDNQVALTYILKMGKLTTRNFWIWSKIFYLELCTIQKDHDYCRISTKPPQSGIRLAVKECSRQQQVGTLYICVQKNLSENGYGKYRPLSFSNVTPTSLLYGLETRSREPSNRCVATNMGRKVPICLVSFRSDFSGTKKAENRKGQNNIYNSHMKNACMVLPTIEHALPKISSDTESNRLTLRSIKKSSCTNAKSETVIGGVEHFRKCLAARGISERAAKLFSNSIRRSSVSS